MKEWKLREKSWEKSQSRLPRTDSSRLPTTMMIAPPRREEICAKGISSMRSAADRTATSPGAAHVGHTQTCGNASLDGVEANQTANQSGTKESADAGQEAENQIGKAEAADDSAKFQIAQADTNQQGGGQVLHDELEPLVASPLLVFWG